MFSIASNLQFKFYPSTTNHAYCSCFSRSGSWETEDKHLATKYGHNDKTGSFKC